MLLVTPRRSRLLGAILGAAFALTASTSASAVVLDSMNQITVKLDDGMDVVLYGEYISKISGRSAEDAEYDMTPLSKRRHIPSGEAAVTSRAAAKGKATNAKSDEEEAPETRQERFDRIKSENAAPEFRNHQKSKNYYYIPPGGSLHLSERPDGVPEFLFVKYTSDKEGGAQGGLFHFLMEWSLTPEQEEELRSKLAKQVKGAELMGAAPIEEDGDGGGFRIISAVLNDDGMTRSLVQSGHAPTMPGGKVAAAANLSADGAQLFLATVEKPDSIADLSIELSYGVTLMVPGAKGEIVFHWDRLQEFSQKKAGEYKEETSLKEKDAGGGCFMWFCAGYVDYEQQAAITESETEEIFDMLVENQVVELIFEGYQADSEYTQAIISAMLEFFKNSLLEPSDNAEFDSFRDDDDGEGEGERPEDTEDQNVVSYKFNKEKLAQAYQSKKQRVKLDFGLAVRKKFQLVGNLASWYDNVKDNEACVVSVNLNDPFFAHREIRFILDLDAKEIFDDMVNYVTVNVRKKRSGEHHDFNESLTIDASYLKEKGIAGSLTYARMEDKDSEAYEYMTQWSLKGGNLFPAKGRWLKGKWEGVTLSPPIERWNIEVEGDLDQMEANDIARVTVEMHYPLFGKESFKVVGLSPRGGKYLVEDQIYVDHGTKGFAYRLIVHHKKEGRMVLPWQTRVGDRYVYATLPEEVLVAGDAQASAKLAAKNLGKMGAEKVLNKFQELFADAD